MTPQAWIERYVHEIGQHLPAKLRSDVQLELHSSLMDALEERAAAAGREPDEEIALKLLTEFGEPEGVALRYYPSRSLIGPELYPYFVVVLAVVLAIASGVHLLALLARLIWSPPADLSAMIGGTFGSWIETVLINIAVVGLIFAVLERLQKPKGAQTAAAWNPRKLPAINDPDRIQPAALVGGVLWNVIFIILLNFLPHWIGLVDLAGGEWGIEPLLAPAFAVHTPWLTLAWGLEAARKLAVLRVGRWSRPLRWAEFAIQLFDLFVLYRMITGGELLVAPTLTLIMKGVLAIIVAIGSLEAVWQLYRLLWGRPFAPWRSVNGRLQPHS